MSFEKEFENRTVTAIECNQTLTIPNNEFKYLRFIMTEGT